MFRRCTQAPAAVSNAASTQFWRLTKFRCRIRRRFQLAGGRLGSTGESPPGSTRQLVVASSDVASPSPCRPTVRTVMYFLAVVAKSRMLLAACACITAVFSLELVHYKTFHLKHSFMFYRRCICSPHYTGDICVIGLFTGVPQRGSVKLVNCIHTYSFHTCCSLI